MPLTSFSDRYLWRELHRLLLIVSARIWFGLPSWSKDGCSVQNSLELPLTIFEYPDGTGFWIGTEGWRAFFCLPVILWPLLWPWVFLFIPRLGVWTCSAVSFISATSASFRILSFGVVVTIVWVCVFCPVYSCWWYLASSISSSLFRSWIWPFLPSSVGILYGSFPIICNFTWGYRPLSRYGSYLGL